jgi:predicted nucleotidyltransferase
LWLTDLERTISGAAADIGGLREVSVFGSALRRPDPNDVDMLVVYDPAELAPLDAVQVRAVLARACAHISVQPVDIVLLTEDEAQDTGFREAEGAKVVYSATS